MAGSILKERKTFCYHSRGSLLECKSWCLKARNRNLITLEEFTETNDKLVPLHMQLNIYIKSLKRNINQ